MHVRSFRVELHGVVKRQFDVFVNLFRKFIPPAADKFFDRAEIHWVGNYRMIVYQAQRLGIDSIRKGPPQSCDMSCLSG